MTRPAPTWHDAADVLLELAPLPWQQNTAEWIARQITEFSPLGAMIAVCCPHDLDLLMRKAGGLWEPGSRRWLIERRRIGSVIRNLRRVTDPLFRHAGIDLDEER